MEDQKTCERCLFAIACGLTISFFVCGLIPILAHADATSTDSTHSTSSMQASSPQATTTATATSTPAIHTNDGLEQQVRTYFPDIPVMIEIARCESRFRQYNDNGDALHGGLAGGMIGLFQLYESIHTASALALGYDINTPEGNMAYARYLYQEQGTDPWLSSFSCWGSTQSPENPASATGSTSSPQATSTPGTASSSVTYSSTVTLTKNLSLGVIDGQVRTLQQILNGHGHILTSSGPGSPGNETEKYGALTRDAVRAFQCKQAIACSGTEYTTGYGYVGPRTRSALLTLAGGASAPSAVAMVPAAVDNAATIAQLQAQIASLLKILAQLQAARGIVAVSS